MSLETRLRDGFQRVAAEFKSVRTALAGKAPLSHTHPVVDISDSTTVGRGLVTAADAAAARALIGAGTSSLALGTTSSTAKAGNYVPTWAEVSGKPTTFAPSAHTHPISDVTNLQTSLDGKVDLWNGAITGRLMYMSPESGKSVAIPYFMNDIAYNNLRGGETRLYADGNLSSTSLDLCFEPQATARSLPVTTTEYVIEVDLWKAFTYGTKVGYAAMESWRAKYIKIEAWDRGTETWKLCHEDSNNPTGDILVSVPSQTGQGITKLRYTFRDFNGTSFRIGQLFLINYSSEMGASYFLPKGGGEVYGAIKGPDPVAATDYTNKKYVDAGLAGKADTDEVVEVVVDPSDPDYYITNVGVAEEATVLGGDGRIREEYVPPRLTKSSLDSAYAPVVDGLVPGENLPASFRTTESQPFRADSIWNMPIGTQVIFEAAGDPATASLLSATPAINDTLNGYGFYTNVARPTDPICTGTYIGSDGQPKVFMHRIPHDPVISAGSDGSMVVVDGRWLYNYWKTTKVDDVNFNAEFITRTDLLGTGRNAGTRAARFPTAGGLIRAHEIAKNYIPHALCISIPPESLKRGFEWPAAAEDAAKVIYSGEMPMGSFLAIPPTVNLDTLGLTPEGYALAECCQNYGMYVGDASGSAAISVDGEAAVAMRPALERMRGDWTAKIFPLLRRVTNVGTTAGGPGPRRVPPSGPVTVRTDYQETIIDVLVNRVRAVSGTVQTSDDCKTPQDPLVSTNAALGGRSVNWTGWASQYRIADGVLKRIATPDGGTRILLTDLGVHDLRWEMTLAGRQAAGWAYIVIAGNGSSDHIRLAWSSTGTMQVQRVVGGTMSVIQGSGFPTNTAVVGRRLGLMTYGPSLGVLIDGEVAFDTTETAGLSLTQFGVMFPSDTTVAVKDLRANSVPRLFRKPRTD